MKINQAGLNIIKESEDLYLSAYLCPARVWTIGWGHTVGVTPTQRITREQADQFLLDDLVNAERAVMRYVKVPLTENQFSALVSFTFNLGPGALKRSTLLRELNNGNYGAVPDQLRRWVKAEGVELNGLKTRREDEAKLWSMP